MAKLNKLCVHEGTLQEQTPKGFVNPNLKGMSLYWDIWDKKYWNAETLAHLKNDWGCNLVRIPIGSHSMDAGYVDESGIYESSLKAVHMVQCAIDNDMYVILDVHNHHAVQEQSFSLRLLTMVSSRFQDCPNVIYEIVNEPLDCSWSEIKDYANLVIPAIRKQAPSAVCLIGTPDWCKDLSHARKDPVDLENVMYTYHFYSATHKSEERAHLKHMLASKVPVFVSECGVSEADGDGVSDYRSFDQWLELLMEYQTGWCAWSVNDKREKSSTFVYGAESWDEECITDTGLYFRDRLLNYRPWERVKGFYASPFGSREEENKRLETEMLRTVPMPISLVRTSLPAIIANAGEKEYDLVLLWLIRNYRKLDRDLKKDLAKAVTEFISQDVPTDPESKWALHRLRDVVVHAETSGKVPNPYG